MKKNLQEENFIYGLANYNGQRGILKYWKADFYYALYAGKCQYTDFYTRCGKRKYGKHDVLFNQDERKYKQVIFITMQHRQKAGDQHSFLPWQSHLTDGQFIVLHGKVEIRVTQLLFFPGTVGGGSGNLHFLSGR